MLAPKGLMAILMAKTPMGTSAVMPLTPPTLASTTFLPMEAQMAQTTLEPEFGSGVSMLFYGLFCDRTWA
jgi:hypothetical protein